MKRYTPKLRAIVMACTMAVSSMAAEISTLAPELKASGSPTPRPAASVLPQKVELTSAEQAKYQQLADQSLDLTTRDAAGASDSTKTVLIVVGVVVVIGGVLYLAANNNGGVNGPLY